MKFTFSFEGEKFTLDSDESGHSAVINGMKLITENINNHNDPNERLKQYEKMAANILSSEELPTTWEELCEYKDNNPTDSFDENTRLAEDILFLSKAIKASNDANAVTVLTMDLCNKAFLLYYNEFLKTAVRISKKVSVGRPPKHTKEEKKKMREEWRKLEKKLGSKTKADEEFSKKYGYKKEYFRKNIRN